VVGDLDDGAVFTDRALVLNPNLATVWLFSGWVRIYRGEPDTALKQFSHSMRLSPLDPLMFTMETGMAFAHFFSSAYNEASSWAEKAIHERPAYLTAAIMATASAALAEQLPQLQISLSRLHQLDPKYRICNLKEGMPFRRPEDLARLEDGLRRAGLPE
jgi:hypothetical protein